MTLCRPLLKSFFDSNQYHFIDYYQTKSDYSISYFSINISSKFTDIMNDHFEFKLRK